MTQPQPPKTRQSGPQAHPAPKDALHDLKPGGPIQPSKQGFVNPGPTDNLRGSRAQHRHAPRRAEPRAARQPRTYRRPRPGHGPGRRGPPPRRADRAGQGQDSRALDQSRPTHAPNPKGVRK